MSVPLLLRKLIGWPVLTYRMQTLHAFIESTKSPEAAQQRKLDQIQREISESDCARSLGLQPGMTIDDFRAATDVADYERMRPWIDRVIEGDKKALFSPSSKLLMFALTSGTTSGAKHIPVTKSSFTEYRKSWTVWGCSVARDWPDIPNGGVLNFASSPSSHVTENNIPIGSMSGLLFRAMHYTMRFTNSVPPFIAEVKDTDERIYLTLRLALTRQDTRMFTTANPSTLIAVAQRLDRWKSDLIRDLYDGTLHRQDRYPSDIIRQAGAIYKVRHKALAKRLEAEGKDNLKPVVAWPLLQLLGVWTGGTLSSYIPAVRRLYGDNIALRDHGLSASEARMTIPFTDNSPSGVLNIDGGFFEFIPAASYEEGKKTTLLPWQLAEGEDYYVILSTCGGLIRYDISDVVRCTGFFNRTPCLQFLNKGSQIGNLTGEKLSAWQAVKPVRDFLEKHRLPHFEYTILPHFSEQPKYIVLLEKNSPINGKFQEQFLNFIDLSWKDLNIEYAEKRKGGRLFPPRIITVPDGFFQQHKEKKMQKQGGTFEQYKHPFFSVDSEMTEGLSRFETVEEQCS